MRAQMAPQASMQMRRGMPRGMAPTRTIAPAPQATVHPARPQARRPPENSMQSRPAPPTESMFNLKKRASSVRKPLKS